MEALLQTHYGLSAVTLTKMDGYISTNYKVLSATGSYVLKVYPYSKRIMEDLKGENEMISRLGAKFPDSFPRPVPNLENEEFTVVEDQQILRLLSFLPGTFLSQAEHTKELFKSLGGFLGRLDKTLRSFESAGVEARKLDWDLARAAGNKRFLEDISNPSDRKLVRYFFLQWDEHVYPQLHKLRKSIIHNDANDWNILVQDNAVSGIIDFGDAVHSCQINELAIALTYALMEKEDPLSWAIPIVSGYHQHFPLEKIELDLLYYLIAGRLITSVCKSAHEKKLQPDSEYIIISERPAWNLLRSWLTIHPEKARKTFYRAANIPFPAAMPAAEILRRRHQSISPIFSISYQKPIYMRHATFQYMFDQEGDTFLDAYNNIPHVGHQHPKVVEAGRKQMAQLNTNTRYLYDPLHEYAEALLAKFPAALDKVYFVNSGSAASDLAIRLAQTYSGNTKMVVMEHGYHGNTRQGIDISPYKYHSKGGKGKQLHIIEAAIPDTFRGKYNQNDGSAGASYASDLIEELNQTEGIAGFIAEPIIGCGGQIPLAEGYLKQVYPTIRAKGGVCISDEVQTGFGRMGSKFWGFELHGVTPDIVVLGKPMGNGHPMGAVVTTTEIAEAFDNGMEFFSSFGGNPVSCKIGSAVLEVMEEENLQENALLTGTYFQEQLISLQKEFPQIGDVRGNGLFLGIELIQDENLTPNTELAQLIKNELRMRHILVSTDGPYDSVIKSKPPLCFDKGNVDQVIQELHNILKVNTSVGI